MSLSLSLSLKKKKKESKTNEDKEEETKWEACEQEYEGKESITNTSGVEINVNHC